MTLGDIAKKARSLVNANITNYSDADLLIDINLWMQKVATMILESQDEMDFDDMRNTTYPIKNIALVAGQRDYPIPVTEKMLKFKRLDVTYDGTNFYKAEPIDSSEIDYGIGKSTSTTQEANLDALFPKNRPRYDIKYGSIFIYPRAVASEVSAGALMNAEWYRQITPFTSADYTSVITDSTVVPGFDDPFHPILSYGPAFEFALSRGKPEAKSIQAMLQDYEIRLKQAYSSKEKDRQFVIGANLPNYGSKGRNWSAIDTIYRP